MNRIVVLTLVLISLGTAVHAAQHTLTLRDAISMALQKNHLVKAAEHSALAARYGMSLAGASYQPGLFVEEGFSISNSPTRTFMMKLDQGRFSQGDFAINNLNNPRSSTDFRTVLTLEQPLFVPSSGPSYERALRETEARDIGVDGVRQEIAFRVFHFYLEVQKAGAQLDAAELTVKDARENMRLAMVRNEAGTGLRSDALRARTHLSSMEQQLITATNNLILARMQLAIAVGVEPGEPLEIEEEVTGLSLTENIHGLSVLAREQRHDLKQARKELEKSDAVVKLARSSWLPSVNAIGSYQLNDRSIPFGIDNDSWLAGVNLRWQIFDGFRRGYERDKAAALRAEAAEMLESRSREAQYQVSESYLRREEMGKRLEVARHALLDAEETVRLIAKRFESSLSTMVDLLDAQTALNQARAALIETEANYLLSTGRVYYTAGTFLKEMLK